MTTKQQNRAWYLTLIEPHPSIEDADRRQRAQVFAGLSLLITVIGVLSTLFTSFGMGDFNPRALFGPIAFLIGYIGSRSKYPEVAATIIAYGAVGVLGLFAVLDDSANPGLVIAAIPLVLLAALTLKSTPTIILAGLVFAGVVALFLFDPAWPLTGALVFQAGISLATVFLAAGTAVVRERDLDLIQEQTEELESYSESLEQEVDQRTRNILATAEIGREITETRNLDELLNRTIRLIIEQFDVYHAQVFVVDELSNEAVLRASTGEAGEKLLAREHSLAVGSNSVIGQVTARNEPVIALDTDTDAVHRRNELLPNTRSEMALPLRAEGRVIGALDIQSVNPQAFGQADIPVFQTMADQLAVAIERIRLLERTQQDLQRIEALNRRLTGEAWGRFAADAEVPQGYRATPRGIEKIEEGSDVAEQNGAVSLPLTVRGETIGVLDIAKRDGSQPDMETQMLLEAVAERVSQALDSTRLGEQARRQAEREVILSRLSAELQATNDVFAIINTAAERTGRALDTPQAFVHLRMLSEGDHTDE